MKLVVDREEGALHLQLCESKILESEEVAPGVILDYNDKKEIVGIEVLFLNNGNRNVDLTSILFKALN